MCSDGYKKLGEFEAIHVGTMQSSSSSHHDEFVFLFLIMMSLDSMERIWFIQFFLFLHFFFSFLFFWIN